MVNISHVSNIEGGTSWPIFPMFQILRWNSMVHISHVFNIQGGTPWPIFPMFQILMFDILKMSLHGPYFPYFPCFKY
jgi:hypothetical protein